MTSGPDGVLFSRDHLWVRITDGTARVGLTDFAQETLGDIVDISVPEANYRVTAGQACGDIESTKSVNDLVAPVSGVVTAINTDLDERPELVNTDVWGRLADRRPTRPRGRYRRPAVGGRLRAAHRSLTEETTMHVHNRFATRSDIPSAAVVAMTNTFLTCTPRKVGGGEPWT